MNAYKLFDLTTKLPGRTKRLIDFIKDGMRENALKEIGVLEEILKQIETELKLLEE